MDIEPTFFVHEGRRIAVVEAGRGPSLLLLHGHRCDHHDWRAQFGPLSADHRVIAPDAPFCGRSDPGPLPPDADWTARALWALLDHLDVRGVVLVGHSGGAFIAQRMVLQQPDRVRAVVSVDSAAGGKIAAAERESRPRVLSPQLAAQWRRNHAGLESLGRGWDYPSDVNLAVLQRNQERRLAFERATQGLPEVAVAPAERRWCRVPLLLFTSGRGRMGPEDLPADWLGRHAAGDDARVVVVRESGHWIMLEAPELFNAELVRFVAELPEVRRQGPGGTAEGRKGSR